MTDSPPGIARLAVDLARGGIKITDPVQRLATAALTAVWPLKGERPPVQGGRERAADGPGRPPRGCGSAGCVRRIGALTPEQASLKTAAEPRQMTLRMAVHRDEADGPDGAELPHGHPPNGVGERAVGDVLASEADK